MLLFARLSPVQRTAVITCAVGAAVATVVTARRDLATRDADDLRGRREVWNRVTYLPGAAVVYLLFARKRD